MTNASAAVTRFVVDDAGFAFQDESAVAIETTLRAFLDLLDYVRETACRASTWSGIWGVESVSGRALSATVFESAELERDLRVLFGGHLSKLSYWDDDESVAPPYELICDNVEVPFAPGIGLCLQAACAATGIGCLTTDQSRRKGLVHTRADDDGLEAEVCFLAKPDDGRLFWRQLVDLEDLDADSIGEISRLAFPAVTFGPDTWAKADRFEGAFRDLRPLLMRDLAGLSDHAPSVWREQVEPARIAAEMSARAGVDCSRESANTHKNKAAMAARTVVIGGRSVECEWHTKLERHRNRVHFSVSEADVLVGIFVDHLET